MADVVQGGIFGGLNFQPLDWGDPVGPKQAAEAPPTFSLPSPSALPSVGGSAGLGSNSIAGAAASAGITGGTITPKATTGSVDGASATPTAAAPSGLAQNWFARGTVVILGFVFVAVGLSQFGILRRL